MNFNSGANKKADETFTYNEKTYEMSKYTESEFLELLINLGFDTTSTVYGAHSLSSLIHTEYASGVTNEYWNGKWEYNSTNKTFTHQ